MAHESLNNSNVRKKIKIKLNADDICTFVACGDYYIRSNFEPQKCLKKNRVKFRRSGFN